MDVIFKKYMLMKTQFPDEMSFEILLFLYAEWKNDMMKLSMIYPGAKILLEEKTRLVRWIRYVPDAGMELFFDNEFVASSWDNITQFQAILLSDPILEIKDALNILNPTLFFSFLEHAHKLFNDNYQPKKILRTQDVQKLFNRFTYFKSINKTQWLKNEINNPMLFFKNLTIDPTGYSLNRPTSKCPASNYFSNEYFFCPHREKYHMCHVNYFINILIKVIEYNTPLTFIDNKYVCIFMFNNLPHIIIISVTHIEINNLYNHHKYDYPLFRIIFWQMALRSGILTQQIFMEHFFENLNKDLLENKFITKNCTSITDMIKNSIIDEVTENNRIIIILLSVLKHGWRGDYENGSSFMIDPEMNEMKMMFLKNGKCLRIGDSYDYALHIIDIFVSFLKIIN